MKLTFYNTLSGRKEEFRPAEPGRVKMYVCGPTTYNYIHLGNARPLVVFDALRRFLEYCGYEVFYVQNFTDIDDKIIARAREEGRRADELAAFYIQEFFRDADALHVRRASLYPRVSQHIPEIVEAISQLIKKGYAYVREGDVYFNVDKFPGYGKLSGRKIEELQAGARVEVDARKLNPLDFALWKAVSPGEPSWTSPWGPGRPGWHIECSTMALKYLGPDFDIHGGGGDLIFPHHENEIAQAEAQTGRPLARYWLHNGFITVDQEKMSKSIGNIFLIREILSHFRAGAVRLFLLSTHYRSPLDYTPERLQEAERGLERLENTYYLLIDTLRSLPPVQDESEVRAGTEKAFVRRVRELEGSFKAALADDFNTALGLAYLYDLAREINVFLHGEGNGYLEKAPFLAEAAKVFRTIAGEVLGLFPGSPGEEEGNAKLVKGLMTILIDIRREARQRKDWATADAIRDRLKELNIILEDTPQGTRWRVGS